MQANPTLTTAMIRRMNEAFFDVSSDGRLVYRDPSIGPLDHPGRGVSVRVCMEKAALELVAEGDVVETFALRPDVETACREAFRAYFRAFEQHCRGVQLQPQAA